MTARSSAPGGPPGAAPVAGVLFDAAGTLIDPREPVGETYARLAARHGARISAWRMGEAFRRALAGASPMAFPGVPDAQVPAHERAWWRARVRETLRAADSAARLDDFEAFFADLFDYYALAEAWVARPGARVALERLAADGLRCGVASNFDGRLPRLLEGLGLLSRLHCVTLPGTARAAKPDPAFFDAALRALGLPAAQVVYVGDEPERNLAGARRAGLRAIDVGRLATLAELPHRIRTPALEPPA